MLEVLDLDLNTSKEEYQEAIPRLREDLRDLQHAVRACRVPVVVLFEGWNAAGKGDSINSLVRPLDPRGFKVYTTQAPTLEEQLHPFLWRFWTRLPAQGELVFWDRSWYRQMLEERVDGHLDREATLAAGGEIREFERQLSDDGVVLIKFWLHISKKEQERRLAGMQSDRFERWRWNQADWKKGRSYKKYLEAAEEMLALTSTANAPWKLVESDNRRFRRVKVFEHLIGALTSHLSRQRRGRKKVGPSSGTVNGIDPEIRSRALRIEVDSEPTVLDRSDLIRHLDRETYEKQLSRLQRRLRDLEFECYGRRVASVVVYEGWDAAGKGGNIKRLTQELDPRGYQVVPITAPAVEEKNHHYLWRFWRQLPKAGHLTIFDRSWYGRVLVERVQGLASEEEWRRAYQEINEFERHLTAAGMVCVKFWLHLSPEEQLRRFQARERTPHKRFKITTEDWRNRARWNDYRAAVSEMIERTSTSMAPWTVVEAEDKLWARVKTLSTLVATLEKHLGV